ncbi:MAG TPA: hypothetical protein VJ739_08350 [Gemmataceae bacterium]|nr:hypothetical protein [Gemmataceae bacterium]
MAGLVGFGLGGALAGLVQFALRAAAYDSAVAASLIATLGFTAMAVGGGIALGLAVRDSRLLRRLVVTGVLGFGVGGLLSLLLIATIQADLTALPPVFVGGIPGSAVGTALGYAAVMYFLAFAVRGAIGGALMGLAVPNRHGVRLLAALGALGFGLGGAAGVGLLNAPPWSPLPLPDAAVYALWLTVSALPGGVALGWGLGILSRSWQRS